MGSRPAIDLRDGLFQCITGAESLAHRRVRNAVSLRERRGRLASCIARSFSTVDSLHRRFRILTEMQPANNCGHWYTRQSREFCRSRSFPAVENRDVVSSITFLCAIARPTTVARFIVPVCVDAVQRVARWTRTHVGQKRREIAGPSLAHRDSTSAVVLVGLRCWSATTIRGINPRSIFTRIQTSKARHMERFNYIADLLLSRDK